MGKISAGWRNQTVSKGYPGFARHWRSYSEWTYLKLKLQTTPGRCWANSRSVFFRAIDVWNQICEHLWTEQLTIDPPTFHATNGRKSSCKFDRFGVRSTRRICNQRMIRKRVAFLSHAEVGRSLSNYQGVSINKKVPKHCGEKWSETVPQVLSVIWPV